MQNFQKTLFFKQILLALSMFLPLCASEQELNIAAQFATDSRGTEGVLFVRPPLGKGDDIISMTDFTYSPISQDVNGKPALEVGVQPGVNFSVDPQHLGAQGKANYRAEIYLLNDTLMKQFKQEADKLWEKYSANNKVIETQKMLAEYAIMRKKLAQQYKEKSDKVIVFDLPFDKNKQTDIYENMFIIKVDTKDPKKHSLVGYTTVKNPSKVIPAQTIKK